MNEREKSTLSSMLRIYCRSKHRQKKGLCAECQQLEEYAYARLEHCPFKEGKPVCKNCTIHCYKKEYREKVQKVMQFSGPRMLFYHPLKAIKHLIESLK